MIDRVSGNLALGKRNRPVTIDQSKLRGFEETARESCH